MFQFHVVLHNHFLLHKNSAGHLLWCESNTLPKGTDDFCVASCRLLVEL